MEAFRESLSSGRATLDELDDALAEQTKSSTESSVELVNSDLWNEFHKHTNEMIITKAGRRMFPLIQLNLTQMDPKSTYYLLLALRVHDNCRWRFLNGEWTGSESGLRGVASEIGPAEGCLYTHPLSGNTGEEMMKHSPVGFSKLKLSNKDSEGGKMKLSSLHRYQPVVYLVQAKKASKFLISTHEMPQTQFIAVTAYQNDLITQMKIKHNPFAKAFLPNQEKASSTIVIKSPPVESPLPHSEATPPAAAAVAMDDSSTVVHWPSGYVQQPVYPYHHGYYHADPRYPPPPPYVDYYEFLPPQTRTYALDLK